MKTLYRACLLASACFATPAFAETTPSGAAQTPDSGGIGDIVVTARRTEESLQTTPVAVTAVGLEAIRDAQIIDAPGLQRIAPSVSIATGAPSSSGFTFISIRGSGALSPGVANDPAVATYVDGVYIARPSQGLTDLIDLQRVEVLRGPQGTLFGRNTTGGALNIVTADPTDRMEGSVRAEAGNYNAWALGSTINLPLSETLAIRANFSHREHGGYGRNPVLNSPVGDLNSDFGRVKLKWSPADSAWNVTLSGDYNHIKDSGQMVALSAVNSAATPMIIASTVTGTSVPTRLAAYLHTRDHWHDSYAAGLVNDPLGRSIGNVLKAYGGAAVINGEFGSVKVRSTTGYRYSDALGLVDQDATPLGILAGQSGFRSKQFSQELQFFGNIAERHEWIAGLYYSNEKGRELGAAQSLGIIGQPIFLNDANVTNISSGAFAQGNFSITDALRLTAGLRWTWDVRNVVLHNKSIFNLPGNVDANPTVAGVQPNCNVAAPDGGILEPCNQTQKAKFNYPAWTIGLDYKVSDDIFVYAKSSHAAKAGGWNVRAGSLPAFSPEKATDIELGAKLTALDRKVRFNVALFHVWQSDVQRNASAVVAAGASTITTTFFRNAGKARIKGAEFELAAQPWSGMELTGSLSLMDGKYADGSYFDVLTGGVKVDRSGEALPQLPKTQFSIGATQKVDLSFGQMSFHADYAYIGRMNFGQTTAAPTSSASVLAQAAAQNALSTEPGYGLLNGRIALELGEPDIEIALFARNLANKKYNSRRWAEVYRNFGFASEFPGNPRVYGVSAQFKW